jgi:hypothetical protein
MVEEVLSRGVQDVGVIVKETCPRNIQSKGGIPKPSREPQLVLLRITQGVEIPGVDQADSSILMEEGPFQKFQPFSVWCSFRVLVTMTTRWTRVTWFPVQNQITRGSCIVSPWQFSRTLSMSLRIPIDTTKNMKMWKRHQAPGTFTSWQLERCHEWFLQETEELSNKEILSTLIAERGTVLDPLLE